MNACSVHRDSFRGWDACFLKNSFVQLVAVPDIGGRIMAYDLGTYPYFFVDPNLAGKLFTPEENQGDGTMGSWKNYGGEKVWPAPQGWDNDRQWHGPPDPVLDTGRYTVDKLEIEGDCAVVVMTSPPDPRTGVQITRQFTLAPNSSRVHIDLTFANVIDRPIRWSIWDVAQLRAERRLPNGQLAYEPSCTVTTPLNPESVFPRGYSVMFGADDNPQWQADAQTGLFKATYQWQIGKVGLDSVAGWIAFSNAAEGVAFVERFTHSPHEEYPDGGATVEVWTVGAGQVEGLSYEGSDIYLMEAEVLGPLRSIPPGGTSSASIEWGACRCAGPVIAVGDAGCLCAPLVIEPLANGDRRITASGGVFDQGELELVWRDAQHRQIAAQSLGAADPLTPVTLDLTVRAPVGAQSLALQMTTGGRSCNLAEGTF